MPGISRRAFLAMSAAAAGGAWMAPSPKARAEDAFGGLRLGMASYTLRDYGREEAIAHTAELGLGWIELFGGHQEATEDEDAIAVLRAELVNHGVQMHAYWAGNLRDNEEQIRTLFEFAGRLSVPLLPGHAYPESLPILDELVKEYDIKVGLHNHGPDHLFDYADEMIEAAEPWDARIGYCLDTGHCMRSGEDPVEVVERLGDRLYGIHLKDQEHIGRDDPPQTILGEGALDLSAFCAALRQVGYDAPISIEYDKQVTIGEIRRGSANFAEAANEVRSTETE